MARLVSVQPRQNPYRENPSGLVIGGVIAALAAAGGAGWYFFGRKKPGGGVGLKDLDQSLVAQLTNEQREMVEKYFPNIATMIAASTGQDPKVLVVKRKNDLMRNLIRPKVIRKDSTPEEKANPPRVSREEGEAMVASGKARWSTGYPPKEFLMVGYDKK